MSSKISLIVGGSSGMGLATAQELVNDGHTVVIAGRDQEKLSAAKAHLTSIGRGLAETISADLYDWASVERLIAHIGAEGRHIDKLVNAAGYFFPKPFLEHARPITIDTSISTSSILCHSGSRSNVASHGGGSIMNVVSCGRTRRSGGGFVRRWQSWAP
jgi:NAD(P)-dependent dehydrogenase (short-subunit alcohol dehydrogenase family)